MEIINFRLMAHPLNWLIVWMYLAFGAFAFFLIHEHMSSMVSTQSGAPIPD